MAFRKNKVGMTRMKEHMTNGQRRPGTRKRDILFDSMVIQQVAKVHLRTSRQFWKRRPFTSSISKSIPRLKND